MAKKKPARKPAKPAKKPTAAVAKKKVVAKKKAPPGRAAKPSAAKPSATKPNARPPAPKGPRVVHWEVQAKDPAAQQRFFAELFGWTIDIGNPEGYGMVPAGGEDSIGGGIGGTTDAPRATFYIEVEDILASLARAEALGGKTIMPRTDIGMIVMAQFRDPEGNLIGLVEAA